MKAPDKIYLNKAEVEIPGDTIVGMAYTRPYNDFVPVEYISKDFILKTIQDKVNGCWAYPAIVEAIVNEIMDL